MMDGDYGVAEDMWWKNMQQEGRNEMDGDSQSKFYHALVCVGNLEVQDSSVRHWFNCRAKEMGQIILVEKFGQLAIQFFQPCLNSTVQGKCVRREGGITERCRVDRGVILTMAPRQRMRSKWDRGGRGDRGGPQQRVGGECEDKGDIAQQKAS